MGRRAPKLVRPSLNHSIRVPESSYPSIDWRQPLTRTCIREVCKKEFVVTGPNQRACPECQDLHQQERRHDYYVDVELPNIDRVYELHNAARAKRCPAKKEKCRICGKDFVKLRCQVTCDDPQCRKQNKINVRAEYDDRERDTINEKRRGKWAANSAEINQRRREKRAVQK
jgi:hypothetical protein